MVGPHPHGCCRARLPNPLVPLPHHCAHPPQIDVIALVTAPSLENSVGRRNEGGACAGCCTLGFVALPRLTGARRHRSTALLKEHGSAALALSITIMNPSSQSLSQLEAARNLALGDGRYYPTIIPGVLPIIGASANATLQVQRWGAEFLAETFASPAWPAEVKEAAALTVLATLNQYLNAEDTGIVKHAVQAAASIYPLIYRHMYVRPSHL